jgi:hypothetical protein
MAGRVGKEFEGFGFGGIKSDWCLSTKKTDEIYFMNVLFLT